MELRMNTMDLAELINTYRAPLVGLIASWGAPWVDAAEIAQDSFAEAYVNRASCRGDWSNPNIFGRWLRGVARNVYRNWARGQRRRQRVVICDSAAVERAVERAVDSPTPEPSQQILRLRKAIEQLPVHQRQVVLMHYLEETHVRQIAVLLSVSAKTVEGRLYQARRSLRRMLDNDPPATLPGKVLICL
jgi:RNA polymerase sigma factor (sigma-70 family)